MGFVCDRPARSFIKCMKGHGGYYACERCEVEGEYYIDRMIYSQSGTKRSDKTFRSQKNPEHHEGVTPLVSIKPCIDLVYHFALDIMHLVYLGVMKKLINEY